MSTTPDPSMPVIERQTRLKGIQKDWLNTPPSIFDGICNKPEYEFRELVDRRDAEAALAAMWEQVKKSNASAEYFQRNYYLRGEAIESLRERLEGAEKCLKALVDNEGLEAFQYLDKGIGTASIAGQRWLNARAHLAASKGADHV